MRLLGSRGWFVALRCVDLAVVCSGGLCSAVVCRALLFSALLCSALLLLSPPSPLLPSLPSSPLPFSSPACPPPPTHAQNANALLPLGAHSAAHAHGQRPDSRPPRHRRRPPLLRPRGHLAAASRRGWAGTFFFACRVLPCLCFPIPSLAFLFFAFALPSPRTFIADATTRLDAQFRAGLSSRSRHSWISSSVTARRRRRRCRRDAVGGVGILWRRCAS